MHRWDSAYEYWNHHFCNVRPWHLLCRGGCLGGIGGWTQHITCHSEGDACISPLSLCTSVLRQILHARTPLFL